jgi:hypothetical protein
LTLELLHTLDISNKLYTLYAERVSRTLFFWKVFAFSLFALFAWGSCCDSDFVVVDLAINCLQLKTIRTTPVSEETHNRNTVMLSATERNDLGSFSIRFITIQKLYFSYLPYLLSHFLSVFWMTI